MTKFSCIIMHKLKLHLYCPYTLMKSTKLKLLNYFYIIKIIIMFLVLDCIPLNLLLLKFSTYFQIYFWFFNAENKFLWPITIIHKNVDYVITSYDCITYQTILSVAYTPFKWVFVHLFFYINMTFEIAHSFHMRMSLELIIRSLLNSLFYRNYLNQQDIIVITHQYVLTKI